MILAVMVLPIITSIARDAMNATPRLQREGALALGATRWETIRYVVLPFARGGISAGIILGLSRAIGETIAVLFVIGAARSFFTGKNGVRSGLEMLMVGSVVAALTYGIGVLFRV